MRELATAKRPLVIGIGGGGDVVGALAVAEHCRLFHGANPIVGGVTWERSVVDPEPGPRRADEIANALEIAPGVLAASGETAIAASGVPFAESRVAGMLGVQTVLVDVTIGPQAIADGLQAAGESMGCDLIVFLDVGGDALAHGDEPGLGSPLCDAVMLAAAARLGDAGRPVLAAIFGIGCDAELTSDEVLARLSDVAGGGGLVGARGLTDPVAQRLEQAIELVPTEASAQAVRAYRGASGRATIRGGTRTLELSPVAALTFYLDVEVTMRTSGRLATAISDASSLLEANAALNALGVRTELDLESESFRP